MTGAGVASVALTSTARFAVWVAVRQRADRRALPRRVDPAGARRADQLLALSGPSPGALDQPQPSRS